MSVGKQVFGEELSFDPFEFATKKDLPLADLQFQNCLFLPLVGAKVDGVPVG